MEYTKRTESATLMTEDELRVYLLSKIEKIRANGHSEIEFFKLRVSPGIKDASKDEVLITFWDGGYDSKVEHNAPVRTHPPMFNVAVPIGEIRKFKTKWSIPEGVENNDNYPYNIDDFVRSAK